MGRIGGDFICSLNGGYVIIIISLIINVVFLVILHLSSNLELQTVGLEHREVSVYRLFNASLQSGLRRNDVITRARAYSAYMALC